jgi:hypothetical protein
VEVIKTVNHGRLKACVEKDFLLVGRAALSCLGHLVCVVGLCPCLFVCVCVAAWLPPSDSASLVKGMVEWQQLDDGVSVSEVVLTPFRLNL